MKLKMQKLNLIPYIAQEVDEKNGIVCLVIMLRSRVMVIKISNNCSFCIFFVDDSKNWSIFAIRFKCT